MYLGRLLGIPIHVHVSVLALSVGFLGWCGWTMGLAGLPAGLILSVGLFLSVLLHELGHAIAAKTYGIGTAHITFYPFGGLAALQGEARTARAEFVIAGAGPAVNGALFVVFALLFAVTGWRFLLVFSAMNLLMMLYNLLPAYPMDGGRMLRAGLATRIGWFAASRRAMQIGQVFGWGFVLLGVVFFSISSLLTGLLLLAALSQERKRIAWLWTFERDQAPYGRA
jgi:Zn-dependent protease